MHVFVLRNNIFKNVFVPPVILYYRSSQGDTSVVIIIVLCLGVDFCAVSTVCTLSYFS